VLLLLLLLLPELSQQLHAVAGSEGCLALEKAC
jgi:hypothetical protein